MTDSTYPDEIQRKRDRARSERDQLDAVLDAGRVCTLSTVIDGRPWVVPMLYARDGDRVLVHGSTGAGLLRHVAAGTPVALCVVHLDGLVVAHSTFDSSANYRSAVVHGTAEVLRGDEAWAALNALSDRIIPGRVAEVRDMLPKEVAATIVLALPIVEGAWTAKVRTGGTGTPEEETEAWMGVVPITPVYGEPLAEEWARERPVPASVRRLVGPVS